MKIKLTVLLFLFTNFLCVSKNDTLNDFPISKLRNEPSNVLFKKNPDQLRVALSSRDNGEVKDWDNHEINSFGFFHKARTKFIIKQNNTYSKDTTTFFKGGGLTIGRWDWILPSSDMYCYVEGTGAISNLFTAKLPTAGLFEFGIGGFFRDSEKKIRWGMGLGAGFRSFFVQTPNSGIRGAAYGMLWPEVVSLIRLSNHITIMPKYIICPMVNNGLMGMRTSSELFVNIRLAGFIGANIRLTSESMWFNDEKQTSNGENFSGKSKNLALQFGVSFNNSIKKRKKYSRDN